MSDDLAFIQPFSPSSDLNYSATNAPADPYTHTQSLSDYLQAHLNDLSKLQMASGVEQLLAYVKNHFDAIIWLDLEIRPAKKDVPEALFCGALLVDGMYWYFDQELFANNASNLLQLLLQARYLGGHHLLDFDLPKLHRFLSDVLGMALSDDTLAKWQAKTWDTLLLSSLLIPHQPTHALPKLYKAHSNINDPVRDCLESRLIFDVCQQVWTILPRDNQILYKKLLPALDKLSNEHYFTSDSDYIFAWETISSSFPDGDKLKLLQLLQNVCSQMPVRSSAANGWQNLGLAAFVNWLRYFNKPQARRPVWLTKHEHYKKRFEEAERAFWSSFDQVSDAWINRQCYQFFGFEALRSGQMAIVRAIFANQDIPLGILPTGGGKSLTFQLPALIFSKYQRQLTIIISPLKALIEDQVINLHSQLPDYASRIAYLISGQTSETQQAILNGLWQGNIDVLYLSPERLRTRGIRQLLKHRPPSFWVLDEAHTLSQWGMDFRPDFLRIAEHIVACYDDKIANNMADKITKKTAQKSAPDPLPKNDDFVAPRIALVTATASARVKDDLNKELVQKLQALGGKQLQQYGAPKDKAGIWRDNIERHFMRIDQAERMTVITDLLLKRQESYRNHHPDHPEQGTALVYLRNRTQCEEYALYFSRQMKAAAFHSKLSEIQKKHIFQQFKNNELDVVVCTNAFGMGIDKAGIHTVIHSGVPENLESYEQEIGRGARKMGEKACAYMLWSEKDIEEKFRYERKSRIANSDTLRNCWQQIRPVLSRPVDDQWFAGNLLEPILGIDNKEALNTQIRVVLLSLERHGLLNEKEARPAWVSIELLPSELVANDALPNNKPLATPADHRQSLAQILPINANLFKLYRQLQSNSDCLPITHLPATVLPHAHPGPTRYYLPELAASLGFSVKNLLDHLRQLVQLGLARWQVPLDLRLKYSIQYSKTLFNKRNNVLDAAFALAMAAQDSGEIFAESGATDGFGEINTVAVNDWLSANNYPCKAKDITQLLRILDILHVRYHNKIYAVNSTDAAKAALKAIGADDNFSGWLALAKATLDDLNRLLNGYLFAHLGNDKSSKSILLEAMADDLMHELGRNFLPSELLQRLEFLQKMDILELSSIDDDSAIFFVGAKKSGKKAYHAAAYKDLQRHYSDRCQRIHMLNFWLNSPDDVKKPLLENYFTQSLKQVIEHYLPKEVDTERPYLRDYQKLILPEHFSGVQKQIIGDNSRASMILAGPGSGKTTVVVHRVAHLLINQDIDPAKILVLAYNRHAVNQLKKRLYALVGEYAREVCIATFHQLARNITGLSEKDAPPDELTQVISRHPYLQGREKQADSRYQWLMEQALQHLQDAPQHFQYIMVDEFQDIDATQYMLIGLLADLQTIDIDGDDDQTYRYEQRGHLMVVGDDDQNLYAFRGASIEFIQQFERNYYLDATQKYYLLDNYRSASNIVQLAADFISQALPASSRLKDDNHCARSAAVFANAPIRFGAFYQSKGIDGASWIAHDIAAKLSVLNQANAATKTLDNTNPAKPISLSIAVLAHQWETFDALRHYLEQLGIDFVSYSDDKDSSLLPRNSFIGRELLRYLQSNPQALIDGQAVGFLQNWRNDNHFNALDKAWQALIAAASGLADMSYGELAAQLESAQYNHQALVSLISYHSAKGLEFDHVYIIDQHKDYDKDKDAVRPLYVALTRAKHTLTVLQHRHLCSKVLCNLLHAHGEQITVPTVTVPPALEFHCFLAFKALVLTPQCLASEAGREFFAHTFVKNGWGNDKSANTFRGFDKFAVISNNDDSAGDGIHTPGGKQICQFSTSFKNKLKTKNCHLSMAGFSTFYYYQQERSYYEKIDYSGKEDGHYLIVPWVKICVLL